MVRAVLAPIARLAWRALSRPGGWRGGALFGVILALELASIPITLRLIQWTADFFDALETVDGDAAVHQLGVFGLITLASAARFLAADYLRKRLLLSWRAALTADALDCWLGTKAYWYLRPSFSAEGVDNPDQRIAEDCFLFVRGLLREALDVIPSVVGLASYIALLWSLSTFPLAFTLAGVAVEIPRYMVWAALLYVALSSLITHLLGRPLKDLYFRQERREADLRYALTSVRDAAGEIALSGGEPAERRRIDARFDALAANWKRLIGREFVLGTFVRPYFQTVLRIPLFLALPAYLAGSVTLGGVMQLASAFSNVTTTLSWFIFSYRDLADLVATAQRLDGLFQIAGAPPPLADLPQSVDRRGPVGKVLRVRGLRLVTPGGEALAPVPDFDLAPGDRVWLHGPSGVGKSTLLCALAGLWPYGAGTVTLPEGRLAFLPQRAYVPALGLVAAAAYPDDPAVHPARRIDDALQAVGLAHLARAPALQAASGAAPSADMASVGLSGGERQRLALARLLIARPDWVFLDEATSALDAEAERTLLDALDTALPHAAIVFVAHRRPTLAAPCRQIRLGPPL